MRPRATPKLLALASLAAASMWLGVISGQLELVVLATPLLVAVAYGCARTTSVEVAAALALPHQRVLEGDELVATLTMTSASSCEVEVGVALPAGIERVSGRTQLVAVDINEPNVVRTGRGARLRSRAAHRVRTRVP